MRPLAEDAAQGAAGSQLSSFWESVVDERAHHTQASHRMVWCDTVQSWGSFSLPEDRPLVP